MSILDILDDAHRRVCIARQRNETDRSRMWTGMGYPSGMRRAVEIGMMTPLSGERPKVSGWYQFTEAGWAAYDAAFADAPDYFSDGYQSFLVDVPKALRALDDARTARDAEPDAPAPSM